MNKDFFLYSDTFEGREGRKKGVKIRRSRTKVELRQFLIPYFTDKYTLKRYAKDKVVSAARKAGFVVTLSEVGLLAQQYRVAYRYLRGDEKTRADIEEQIKKKLAPTRGLRCLINDGISTWEQLEKFAKAQEKLSGVFPEKEAEQIPKDKEFEPSSAKPEEPAQKGVGAVEERFDPYSNLVVAVTAVGLWVKDALEERQGLLAENAKLRSELAALHEELAEKQKEAVAALTERETNGVALLQNLASQFPQFPELFRLAKKIRETLHPKRKPREIPEAFPKVSLAEGNARMIYQPTFLDDFAELARFDQIAVEKALAQLSKYGYRHPSLQSKKLYREVANTPAESYMGRAGQDLRFSWIREKGKHTFLNIFRRGDSRLKYSEA